MPLQQPGNPKTHLSTLCLGRGSGLGGWKVGAQLLLQEASEDRQKSTKLLIPTTQRHERERKKGMLEQLLRTVTENGRELLVPQTHCIHLLPPQLGRQVVYKWYGHRS